MLSSANKEVSRFLIIYFCKKKNKEKSLMSVKNLQKLYQTILEFYINQENILA